MNTIKHPGIIFSLFLSLLLLAGTAVSGIAAEYPSKPINVVVGWGAGGGVDTFTRIVGKYAPEYVGQRFVVSNKKRRRRAYSN